MSKRLVVCCDGTWNTPDEMRGDVRAPTNVSKIALGLAHEGRDGAPQLLHYEHGVGTRRFEHLSGGAFGYGLSRNVRACYRFVVDNYEPRDKLYFFGFSRGAYTARSTVGLIHNCGILRSEHRDRIDEAYGLYRSRSRQTRPNGLEARIFRRMYSHDEIEIEFVGVWDTVGALGIPIDGLRIPFIERYWGFHDTQLSRYVRSAYQALAIDEQRGPFTPTLWRQHEAAEEQTLEQVWFAGVHCDVGGGYDDPALAEIPLLWMVERATDCGLTFEPDHFRVGDAAPADEPRCLGAQLSPDALHGIHTSRTGFYRLFPRRARDLAEGDGQSAASSAVRRLQLLGGYDPPSLERWAATGRPVTIVQNGRGAERPLALDGSSATGAWAAPSTPDDRGGSPGRSRRRSRAAASGSPRSRRLRRSSSDRSPGRG
jgi:hypothetical protein